MLKILYNEYNHMTQNPLITVFITCVIADFITGSANAWTRGELNSKKAFRGASKHLVLLIILVLFYPYLGIFDLHALAYPYVLAFIAQYGISIVENLGALGVKIPTGFVKHLNRFNEEGEYIEDDDNKNIKL